MASRRVVLSGMLPSTDRVRDRQVIPAHMRDSPSLPGGGKTELRRQAELLSKHEQFQSRLYGWHHDAKLIKDPDQTPAFDPVYNP